MLVVWALEQRASPSLLADRLGALNHSLRFSRSRPSPSCFCMRHEVNHRVTRLFFQGQRCPGSWIRNYPAHFRIAVPVARNSLRNAAFGCPRADCPSSFPLELCLQLCIHKLPKLIALCFLAVRVLNFVVKHVCFVGTLSFASFCNGLQVIKTSWSAFGCCRSCGGLLAFRLGLHQSLAVLCPPGPQETARTTLSSQRRFSTAQQYQPICTPRHSSSLQSNICSTSWCVSATEAKSFNPLDNLRANTPDALLTETFAPKPETACNSLSATAARS